MLYRTRLLGIAAAAALAIAALPASAQVAPTKVRVKAKRAKVMLTTAMASDVIDEFPEGTEMDVLLQDDGWYWVVLPPDGYGTRRGGWVRVHDVDGTTEAELIAKAEKAVEKHAAEEAKKQAAADKRAAEAANHAAQAEQKAAAKEAQRSAKAEQQAAKHGQHGATAEPHADVNAQQTTNAGVTSASSTEDKRLKKVQQDLEKARADYDAALKKRGESTATPAVAPQR
jgi:hypothetical protein